MALIEEDPMTRPMHKILTEERRQLMLRCMDGHTDLAGTMHILNGYKYCDTFLQWLISHGYTGKYLKQLVILGFHSNVPDMVNWLVTVMRKPSVIAIKGDQSSYQL